MTLHKVVAEIDAFDAPWGKTVRLRQIEYEGGLVLLQVQIREGRRITLVDLDPATATRWAAAMAAWVKRREAEAGGPG